MKIYAKKNFKEIRMKKGYSIVGLAEKTEISKQALGQIERRINGISPENSQKIISTLNTEFDSIFELVE